MPNASDFNRFSVNPINIDISRSAFNLDHSVKWSCNVGEVIPFDIIEVLPGDTFEIDSSKVIRLQPLVAPIMDEIVLDTYWFFVPHRLVWSHWKEFMGENNSSAWAPDVEYNIPTITSPHHVEDDTYYWNVGTIADYMGLPVGKNDYGHEYNALPFRSYALICDQWFRSEAIMDPVHVHVDDTNRNGVNTNDQVTDIELGGRPFIACKFFDYFTSCLPSPQRGDAVGIQLNNVTRDLPLRFKSIDRISTFPYYNGKPQPSTDTAPHVTKVVNGMFNDTGLSSKSIGHSASGWILDKSNETPAFDSGSLWINNGYVNLPALSGTITINDLRSAFAVQKYLEKQARFGGRYIEFIKGFFGVDSPDARQQRTEYLGGSRFTLNINQVEQTSATQDGTTPLGDVAGMSVTADSNSDLYTGASPRLANTGL